jgi:saccharopine dehydrogenase (NAD+, L-lysine-forming)
MKLGIIREGKVPPDKRVPFTPAQCVALKAIHGVDVLVQKSEIRAIKDHEYEEAGVKVVEDIGACDILMGIKEVPIDQLIPNKKYFFFSHTYKEQPHNRALLQAILAKNIQLIDYELLTNAHGARLVAFGRYAGVVGAYNALRGWGEMTGNFTIKPAHAYHDRAEMDTELKDLHFNDAIKIVLTGKGRVAGGAIETLVNAGIRYVEPDAFLAETFDEPVYTDLGVDLYNKRKDGQPFTKSEFYQYPEDFESNFMRFAEVADIYVACHYWDAKAPFIFTRADAKKPAFNIKLVADVSCDIDGPVASTIRSSTIDEPFYGYAAMEEKEVPFASDQSIGVMAIDNLPCELPRDASASFGRDLLNNVIPRLLLDDEEDVIGRATQTKNGALTPHFAYLQDFVDGKR